MNLYFNVCSPNLRNFLNLITPKTKPIQKITKNRTKKISKWGL